MTLPSFLILKPSPLQISNAPTPAIRTQRSVSRTFAAPLDVGCALDEVVLAVVEAEFATIDVELGTKDDREVSFSIFPAAPNLTGLVSSPKKIRDMAMFEVLAPHHYPGAPTGLTVNGTI